MKIYIFLPVHNRIEKTRLFIDSLLSQSYGNYHLILVDDGSTDGTQDYVRSKVEGLTVITGSGNWWWAGGLHQGYLWIKKHGVDPQDVVLLINNDTEFAPDFFQTAAELLAKEPKTLLLARVFRKQSGELGEAGVHADWRRLTFDHTEIPEEVNCLSTRGLFLRAGDFLDIGGFYPAVLPHYLSDYEFTIRAHHKGYRLMTDPALTLKVDELTTGFHAWHRAASRGEFFRDYFSRRSSSNPFSWFVFVALACPWPWKPLNLLKVIYGGLATVFRKTFGIYNHKWQ